MSKLLTKTLVLTAACCCAESAVYAQSDCSFQFNEQRNIPNQSGRAQWALTVTALGNAQGWVQEWSNSSGWIDAYQWHPSNGYVRAFVSASYGGFSLRGYEGPCQGTYGIRVIPTSNWAQCQLSPASRMLYVQDADDCPSPYIYRAANLRDCPSNQLPTSPSNIWKVYRVIGGVGQLVPMCSDPANPSCVRGDRPLAIVAHGWKSSPNEPWVQRIASGLAADVSRFGAGADGLANVDVLVADTSQWMNPPVVTTLPGLVADLAANEGFGLLQARTQIPQASQRLVEELRCRIPRADGQRLQIPLIIGHSFGGAMAARLLPDMYAVANIGTLVTVDTPWDMVWPYADLFNEQAYAGLSARWVNIYSDDLLAGFGFGSRADLALQQRALNLYIDRDASRQVRRCFSDHSCLVQDFSYWLFSPQGRALTTTAAPLPGEARSYRENIQGGFFNFQPTDGGTLPSMPSTASLVLDSIVTGARSPLASDITTQLRASSAGAMTLPDGSTRVTAQTQSVGGYSLGDVPLPPDAGYLVFEYQTNGLIPCCESTPALPNDAWNVQVASLWANDRLLFTTNRNTPPNTWAVGVASVAEFAGSGTRIAAAISRQSSATSSGQFTFRNVRTVPARAVYDFGNYAPDCNTNGVYDWIDIAGNPSLDSNANFVIDSCQACKSIDFNQNSLFPEDQDLIDFLSVLAGGPCSEGNTCNDIDFNNDGLFPADDDLVAFLRVLAGGSCN